MNTSRNLLIAAAAAMSFAAVASSANAQATATGTGTASVQILKALTVSGHHDLAFGKVASGQTAGAVAIAEGGGRSASGGAVLIGGSTATAADFTFNGEPSTAVTVSYSDSAGAANAGGQYALSNGTQNVTLTITSTKVGSTSLGSDGNLTVPIAGSVAIPAQQGGGQFTGSYYVTVAYN
jgi:hypothetical protein